MNTLQWMRGLLRQENKKPLPILSFPAVSLLGVSVYELTRNADLQAKGMQAVAEKTDAAAAVGMMDLSVEAEAFGCQIKAAQDEVPTVIGALVTSEDEANALRVPQVGEGRTGIYVEASAKAVGLISDRPVFSGMLGPFSLAGRLMEVSEVLVNCLTEPELVHIVMEKATRFLIDYAGAYKKTGAAGLLMAEPLAGLLSPELEAEFSTPYVKQIIDAVQDESFCVIYHNCGPNTPLMTESISQNGAAAYHFGDAVDLEKLLQKMPADKPVFGNISPSAQFLKGTPQSIYDAATALLQRCAPYENFVLSSGCDIPPAAPWENIDGFFAAARDFYQY